MGKKSGEPNNQEQHISCAGQKRGTIARWCGMQGHASNQHDGELEAGDKQDAK